MTPNLDKSFWPFEHMRVGDPYTIIDHRSQVDSAFHRVAIVGDRFTKWFATNEDPRIFRITAVHWREDGCRVYETVFIGFAVGRDRSPDAGIGAISPRKPPPGTPGADNAFHRRALAGAAS